MGDGFVAVGWSCCDGDDCEESFGSSLADFALWVFDIKAKIGPSHSTV